eukprot:g21251.t1
MNQDKSGPCGKADYISIRQKLGSVNWEELLSGKSTFDMWDLFKDLLIRVQDRYFPVRRKGKDGKVRDPWITRRVVNLVESGKEVYVRLRKLKSDRDHEKYKESRKVLQQGIRRARRDHEMTKAGRFNENPKAFYRYVKNKRITEEKVGPLKDKGENLCLEAEDVGEILNEYIASVFTQEKDMEDGKICVEHADVPGNFEIKNEMVL